MPSDLERRAIQRLINKAEGLGLADQVPPDIRLLATDHGPTNGGSLAWDRKHPDEDVFRGCCDGEMIRGAAYCTCWEPVFDLEQADPIPPGDGEIQVRPGGLCGDCAYRPESPEMATDFMAEALRELPLKGQTFWCHDGMRRPIRWEHPDGRTIDGSPDDYQPPMVDGRPHRADGRVGHLCAGWAACSRRWDNLSAKQEKEVSDHA